MDFQRFLLVFSSIFQHDRIVPRSRIPTLITIFIIFPTFAGRFGTGWEVLARFFREKTKNGRFGMLRI